jgi:hypothetical protein
LVGWGLLKIQITNKRQQQGQRPQNSTHRTVTTIMKKSANSDGNLVALSDASDTADETCSTNATPVSPNVRPHHCFPKNRLAQVLRSIVDMNNSLRHEDCNTDESLSLGGLLVEMAEHNDDEAPQPRDLQYQDLATAPDTTSTSGPVNPVDILDFVTDSLRTISLMDWKDRDGDGKDSRLDSDDEDALKDSIHLAKERCRAKQNQQEKEDE